MARAAELGGHAHERLALRRFEPVRGQHDRLARLEALAHGRLQQLLRARRQLLLGDASGQQRAHLPRREHRGAVLDHAREKAVQLGVRGADHDEQAARRVAQSLGWPQHTAVHEQAGGSRGAVAARTIR